jgi:hypothetical protein
MARAHCKRKIKMFFFPKRIDQKFKLGFGHAKMRKTNRTVSTTAKSEIRLIVTVPRDFHLLVRYSNKKSCMFMMFQTPLISLWTNSLDEIDKLATPWLQSTL